MELTGKIIEVLELQTGAKKDGGTWQKQQYVLETEGEYPKKVCFMVWGDNVDKFNIQKGELVKVDLDLESREYNGRWYTDVKVWQCRKLDDPKKIEGKKAEPLHTSEGFDDDGAVDGATDGADDLPF